MSRGRSATIPAIALEAAAILTAAGLRLKTISNTVQPEARPSFEQMLQLLSAQQRRIREFVTSMNPKPSSPSVVPVCDVLTPITEDLSTRWQCTISTKVLPTDATLPVNLIVQIRFILSEAVANAVRHGNASELKIGIDVNTRLHIEVHDNGSADIADQGQIPQAVAVPFSIIQRVKDLHGDCTLNTGPHGGVLLVDLPLG